MGKKDAETGTSEVNGYEAHESETGVVEVVKSAKAEERERKRREKRKKKLIKEAEKADKRGVCYLSRIPPKMDPKIVRQILSPYGEILRIYLAPEDPSTQIRRKQSGGFRGQGFSEGWVEFADKRVAKRVANLLNGEQIGGKKRSQFYYDIWNIKYLSKFKWDDLIEETACKNAVREQKLRMELSAAKKERDFYLNKVEQSRGLSEMEERLRKKRKAQKDVDSESPEEEQKPKVIRHFTQKRPFVGTSDKTKSFLSPDVLAEIFNAGNDET